MSAVQKFLPNDLGECLVFIGELLKEGEKPDLDKQPLSLRERQQLQKIATMIAQALAATAQSMEAQIGLISLSKSVNTLLVNLKSYSAQKSLGDQSKEIRENSRDVQQNINEALQRMSGMKDDSGLLKQVLLSGLQDLQSLEPTGKEGSRITRTVTMRGDKVAINPVLDVKMPVESKLGERTVIPFQKPNAQAPQINERSLPSTPSPLNRAPADRSSILATLSNKQPVKTIEVAGKADLAVAKTSLAPAADRPLPAANTNAVDGNKVVSLNASATVEGKAAAPVADAKVATTPAVTGDAVKATLQTGGNKVEAANVASPNTTVAEGKTVSAATSSNATASVAGDVTRNTITEQKSANQATVSMKGTEGQVVVAATTTSEGASIAATATQTPITLKTADNVSVATADNAQPAAASQAPVTPASKADVVTNTAATDAAPTTTDAHTATVTAETIAQTTAPPEAHKAAETTIADTVASAAPADVTPATHENRVGPQDTGTGPNGVEQHQQETVVPDTKTNDGVELRGAEEQQQPRQDISEPVQRNTADEVVTPTHSTESFAEQEPVKDKGFENYEAPKTDPIATPTPTVETPPSVQPVEDPIAWVNPTTDPVASPPASDPIITPAAPPPETVAPVEDKTVSDPFGDVGVEEIIKQETKEQPKDKLPNLFDEKTPDGEPDIKEDFKLSCRETCPVGGDCGNCPSKPLHLDTANASTYDLG